MKEIPGFPGYYADINGVVYCVKKNGKLRQLKPIKKGGKNNSNYMQVHLRRDNKEFTKKIHHIILETFVGPRSTNECVARHLNDIPYDNRLCNLRWGTHLENAGDRRKLTENEESQISSIIKKAFSLGVTEEELSIITRWNLEKINFLNST